MPQKPESPSLFTHAKSAVDGFRGMRETLANERPDAIVARMHHTLLAPRSMPTATTYHTFY